MTKKTTNLFDNLYSASADFLKSVKKPFVKKKLKRMLESYYDSCLEKMMQIADDYVKSIANIEKIDSDKLESLIESRQEYDRYEALSEKTRSIYLEFFGEEMAEGDIDIKEVISQINS